MKTLPIGVLCLVLTGCANTPENRAAWEQAAKDMEPANRQLQEQTQRNNQQTMATIQQIGQNSRESYRTASEGMSRQTPPVMTTAQPYPSRPAQVNLPTQQQLNTAGSPTGRVERARDGTEYREYRRPDGTTYLIATPPPALWPP